MGLIRKRVTVNSGTTNLNIVAGEIFEFLSRPSTVQLFCNQEEVANSALEVTMNLGNVVVVQDATVNIASTNKRIDRQEDALPAAVGAAGDRIQITVRETTAGAGANGILDYMLEITEIA